MLKAKKICYVVKRKKNYVIHICIKKGDDLTFQNLSLVGYDFIHSCGVLVMLKFNLKWNWYNDYFQNVLNFFYNHNNKLVVCFNIEFHLEVGVDEIINGEVMEGHQYHTCYSPKVIHFTHVWFVWGVKMYH